MSKNLNISVLVAARDEYIEQLKCIVVSIAGLTRLRRGLVPPVARFRF
jgi:hypothetical protein